MRRTERQHRHAGPSLSRRELLRTLGRGAGAAALAPLLARCAPEDVAGGSDQAGPVAIRVASLPLAIDRAVDEEGDQTSPSLERFTHETGIIVELHEVVGDAATFARQLLPRLSAAEPTGWDVVVLTVGEALAGLIRRGYLEELPRERPNFEANAGPFVRDPSYDPGNRLTTAWRGDVTGIGYNPRLAGRPAARLRDLFDPAFSGKIGMPADPTELGNVGLLAVGADPSASSPEEWEAAASLLRRQRDRGVVRAYYGRREAVAALAGGEVALAVARSSDLFQANLAGDPQGLRFAYPPEGAVLWTDAMCIPAGSEHVGEAVTFIDFVYRPDVAAMIATVGGYVSPVPASRTHVRALATAAAEPGERARLEAIAASPLVFPSSQEAGLLRDPAVLGEDREVWDELFRSIAGR